MNNISVTMVVPVIPRDFRKLLVNLDIYFSLLPISKICIIGNVELKSLMPDDKRLFFINENQFVDIIELKNIIIKKTGNEQAGKRTGWYVQQFVKLGYSRMCEDEYYLLWDSDTVPVKKINFFDDNKIPYFDCKTEYHKPYFDTISKLFPNHEKMIKTSFISEHMLVNAELMRRMLCIIENNNVLEGRNYYEKIINAVNPIELPKSGFSEFETFGTYVCTEYPLFYKIRKWQSLRYWGLYFKDTEALDENTMQWLAKKYDAVSYEKRDSLSKLAYITPWLRKFFSPSILEILSIPIRGYRKLFGYR